MTLEERQKREAEQYRRLNSLRPDLFRSAVQIGSLPTILNTDNFKLAARIEAAIVDLLLKVIDE